MTCGNLLRSLLSTRCRFCSTFARISYLFWASSPEYRVPLASKSRWFYGLARFITSTPSCSRERDRSPAEAIADCATDDCLLIQPTDCFPSSSFLLLSFLPRTPRSGFLSSGCFLFEAGVKLRTDRDRERERWRRGGGRCHTTSCKPYSGFEGGHLISFVIHSTSP